MELQKRLLRTKEAASYLSVSPWKLRAFVHEGTLPHIQMDADDGSWRFDVADLDKFISNRRVVGA